LTPALQQSIRLLQLSSLDLQAEIERALNENPMLEDLAPEGSEGVVEPVVQVIQAVPTAVPVAERGSSSRHSLDDEQSERPQSSASTTLREHLLSQLGQTRASPRDVALVSLLIDDLNDDGFLESSLQAVCDMLEPHLQVEIEELQTALRLLQSFDPVGIGARDLAECLSLQLVEPDLEHLPALADPEVLRVARVVCAEHLETLASGNMTRLQSLTQAQTPALRLAHACILRLNPRPASPWSKPAADYAIPDIIVRKTVQGWRAALNESALPKLKVNDLYAQALGSARNSEHSALHGQLQEARWLIRNINQRFETIMRVAEFIVEHQQPVFDSGWGALKPLTLREVAQALNLHESTISRATNQKYMLSPLGTIELKRFFGTGVSALGGQATSSTAVQTRIRHLIDHEPSDKPLSDSQLVTFLDQEGITVARRTVAKYRELLRIPTASLRKSHGLARRSET
jgi:RNA polymerase sigma-54 factor